MGTYVFSETVVVRDQDEEVVQLIREFLEPLGCMVVAVQSRAKGDEADLAVSPRPNVV